jgi:3-methyladenine DNA glycosylase Tag
MNPFDRIIDFAAQHHGDRAAVLKMSQNAHQANSQKEMTDDRYLATMTRCVFNAGFNWKVIDAKWAGFEAAFEGFDPNRLAFFGDEMLGQLVSDTRIVRNGQKIKATLENAKFVADTAKAHGSFGAFLSAWPAVNQAGLLGHLNTNGSRLGGATGQYFLRFTGWDAWITSGDVCRALVREEVLDKPEAKSRSAIMKVQAAFNHWHAESSLPYAQISRILALSVG